LSELSRRWNGRFKGRALMMYHGGDRPAVIEAI